MTSTSSRSISPDILDHGIRRARLGVWDWNLQTDECTYSDSWFEMLGYRPGEIEQTSDLWMRLAHPDDLSVAQESGERHLRGETAEIETELRLKHKDGRWLWVLDRGGVVERLEQVLHRPAGIELQMHPRKAVARLRRPLR